MISPIASGAAHERSKAMDISADLQELARCPVGLVSAGVKSILDIGRYTFYAYIQYSTSQLVRLQNFGVPCMFVPLDCSSFVPQR